MTKGGCSPTRAAPLTPLPASTAQEILFFPLKNVQIVHVCGQRHTVRFIQETGRSRATPTSRHGLISNGTLRKLNVVSSGSFSVSSVLSCKTLFTAFHDSSMIKRPYLTYFKGSDRDGVIQYITF